MNDDIVYATVRCCRDWTIIYFWRGVLWPWRKCGICRELPVLVDVEGVD